MRTDAKEYMEMLREIQNSNSSSFTSLPTTEPRFIIDTNTREINVPPEFSFLGVQNDHKAETIYFEIDRYFDNEDLANHTCVIQFINGANEGIYPVTELDVDTIDGKIIFGWQIYNDSTQNVGDVSFSVRFYSLREEGNGFEYNFNTLPSSSRILETLNVDGNIVKVNPSEIEAWLEVMNELSKKVNGTVEYVETKSVFLGDNVLGSATLGEGWTETDGVFTHATGSDADLTFETTVEEGSIYILEFDTSYAANEFVRVGIGDRYRVLCYQGKSHITVPLMASGGTTLYITPINDAYSGSISNITIRKIQENGTECVLELYSTVTENHTQNYGFWNTFIGNNTAVNAIGSTRSIAIGYYTLNALQGGHRNIGIGTFAMSQLIGGEENISIGADSMLAVKEAETCVVIGMSAMYEGASRKEDIAIGKNTLRGDPTSATEKNIAIGANAGYKVTTAKNNIFIGNNSGYNNKSGYCNTYIGDGAGKSATTGYFNTIIGRNADLPANANNVVVIGDGAKATKSKQAVIGADNITETLVKGNLVVRGTDGVYRQVVFNTDGTCSWTAVE